MNEFKNRTGLEIIIIKISLALSMLTVNSTWLLYCKAAAGGDDAKQNDVCARQSQKPAYI